MKTALTWMLLGSAMIAAVGCSKHDFGTIPTSEVVVQESDWNAKVDFLILVDNSPSMLKYQTRLAKEIPDMVAALEDAGIDAHFAIVTTTMNNTSGGRFVGTPRFLTSQSEDLVASLQKRVELGETGSNVERGFEAILKALSPSYLAAEGAGFLRDEALLSLVLLTNENDYSDISPAKVGAFLDELKPPIQAQRTTYRNWVANHLGVLDLEGSCRSSEGFNEPSEEFMALADISGGIKASICDSSFGDAVANIKKRLIEVLTDFRLPRQPIEDSIKVFVNGKEIPEDDLNGWSYIKEGNLIRFNGNALPNPDAKIAIDFTPAGGV
jgi:hypothetical protein